MTDERTNHLSWLEFDLFLLGDLSEEAVRAAKRHLGDCPACSDRYQGLQQSHRYFLTYVHPRTSAPVALVIQGISVVPSPPKRGLLRRWTPAFAAVVAAAAALLFVIGPLARSDAPLRIDGDRLLAKGGPLFDAYARHQGHVFPVVDGAHLEPGDALLFTADPGAFTFLLIASIDAAGKVTVYVPYDGQESAPIAPGRHFQDDSSIVLDETRGPERIFALFSNHPLEAAPIRRALDAVGRRGIDGIRNTALIQAPAEFQTSILIEK